MSKCASIDPLVTPYIDGELTAAQREAVERHACDCPPCRGRLIAEQAARGVVTARRSSICSERASAALKARCASLRAADAAQAAASDAAHGDASSAGVPARALVAAAAARPSWRRHLAPLSLAAALVLLVGAAFLYQLTARSSRLMAAELAADHMKCFAMNSVLGTHDTADVVESSMASGFDWRMQMPVTTSEGLELVGSRPCLYAEGKVAHIMFHHNGTPVSLFMLPKSVRADELVHVLGHEAAIWSVGDRTFVLIARETGAEVERMAALIQTSLH